jgi:hypothetical protein
MNLVPERSKQSQQRKIMKQDASDVPALEKRNKKICLGQSPRRSIQEPPLKVMHHKPFTINAATEAGSRRAPELPLAPPIERSKRRRIIRREARRRGGGLESASVGGTNREGSAAEDQETRLNKSADT